MQRKWRLEGGPDTGVVERGGTIRGNHHLTVQTPTTRSELAVDRRAVLPPGRVGCLGWRTSV